MKGLFILLLIGVITCQVFGQVPINDDKIDGKELDTQLQSTDDNLAEKEKEAETTDDKAAEKNEDEENQKEHDEEDTSMEEDPSMEEEDSSVDNENEEEVPADDEVDEEEDSNDEENTENSDNALTEGRGSSRPQVRCTWKSKNVRKRFTTRIYRLVLVSRRRRVPVYKYKRCGRGQVKRRVWIKTCTKTCPKNRRRSRYTCSKLRFVVQRVPRVCRRITGYKYIGKPTYRKVATRQVKHGYRTVKRWSYQCCYTNRRATVTPSSLAIHG